MNWRDWASKKAKLQLLALLLALIAWFLVHSSQTVKQTRSFDLVFEALPSEFILTQTSAEAVEFTLTGSFHRLRSLTEEERFYPIAMDQYTEGQYSVEIDSSLLPLPYDIEASIPNPPRVEFEIQKRVEKSLPVELQIQGEPEAGYRVSELRAKPESIAISGPHSLIHSLDRYSLSVPVTGLNRSVSRTELVRFESPLIQSTPSITVEIDVVAANLVERELMLPVRGEDATRALSISPGEAKIRVVGPEQLLEEISADLKVLIPTEGLQRNRRLRIRGRVVLPPGIEVLQLEPDSFIVEALD